MSEITWHNVKTDGNPRRRGTYLVATLGNKKAILGDFQQGKWVFHGYESENGNPLEMSPYAWADFPIAPKE